MSLPPHLATLDARIRAVFADEDLAEELLPFLATWTEGGCWPAARALASVIGGELLAVASERWPVEHVVVAKDGYVIDADGVQTPDAMLAKMRRGSLLNTGPRAPYLVPLERARARSARSHGLECPRDVVARLVQVLRGALATAPSRAGRRRR